MNSENNINWWSKHKKKVFIVAGITATVAACGIVLYINRDSVVPFAKETAGKISSFIHNTDIVEETKTTIIDITKEFTTEKKVINNGEPFNVSEHIRNMSQNKRASTEKLELAKKLGLELKEHQTFVESYTKNIA